MSISKAKKQRLRPVRTSAASGRAKLPIDRLAAWIGRRSRLIRALFSLGVAAILTVDLALLLFGSLLNANPAKLKIGPLNADNISLVLLVFVISAGFALYWVGWRTMIGFDLDDEPLQPGRPAAFWLLLGVVALAFTVILGGLTLLLAVQT